ncbi:MAG: hypothetical protein KU28_06985 [Sulfurovum sp. PC08-66]|nr:MAG: hypothetical protein KU28_06985 [Sulfurovum sp. PC08-66]
MFDNLLSSSYKVVFSGVSADYLFTAQNQGGIVRLIPVSIAKGQVSLSLSLPIKAISLSMQVYAQW